MTLSIFDLFSIGIGPSSSHSVGPMRAARLFLTELLDRNRLDSIQEISADLFGSLALTGKGHGTDKAVLLGLLGECPESVDPDRIDELCQSVHQAGILTLLARKPVPFDERLNLRFRRSEQLPYHPNGIRFSAKFEDQHVQKCYYSLGGGFVISEEQAANGRILPLRPAPPFQFRSSSDLIKLCQQEHCSISQLILRNELTWLTESEIRAGLFERWSVMQNCVERGCSREGILPGGLRVKRRAAGMRRSLTSRPESSLRDPLSVLDWVDLYALAVNEENAAGGRVVTAPTNGAAGIIPAVLHYYSRFVPGANEEGIIRFFLTAGAIGMLYKMNASISGAEVGCQGEVGVACSMAAGALTEVLGGSINQVEQAAEIGMEHNLGLTCDPIRGLVQIPCIERNAMGAVKAINASRLALRGDGEHRVSLDKVIATMRRTGADMSSKYKETSLGGLAVNVTEC